MNDYKYEKLQRVIQRKAVDGESNSKNKAPMEYEHSTLLSPIFFKKICLELADFKTHGMLRSNNACVPSVFGAYYTRARSLFAVKFVLSAPLPLTRAGLKWKKKKKTNRLLREVTTRQPPGVSPACRIWPNRPTRGRDVSPKRRWNLNVYLKYIQKEVTVSLSCAGFYNSPFSISHVRKMFLPLVTAQCTTVVFFFNVLFRYTDANES